MASAKIKGVNGNWSSEREIASSGANLAKRYYQNDTISADQPKLSQCIGHPSVSFRFSMILRIALIRTPRQNAVIGAAGNRPGQTRPIAIFSIDQILLTRA